MTKQECYNCRFMRVEEVEGNRVARAMCHRNAPVPQMVPFTLKAQNEQLTASVEWPVVSYRDWCGEWRKR